MRNSTQPTAAPAARFAPVATDDPGPAAIVRRDDAGGLAMHRAR